MQNSPEVEFNKFIFENLLRYVPDNLVTNVPVNGHNIHHDASHEVSSNGNLASAGFWQAHKPTLVRRLSPITVLIGLLEVIVGLLTIMLLGLYNQEYDKMYNTEISKVTSNATYFGSFALSFSGFMLLLALLMENQQYIRYYIFVSVFVCVYLFMLACMKIHFALLAIEREAYTVIRENSKYSIFLSTACVLGVATLLGSVVHFIGIVTVFTYYNLKYLR